MSWQDYDTAQSFFVSSTDEPNLRLHLRSRGGDTGGPPVLFVHGATFASRLYDIPHPGASWLQAMADIGFTAYALDIRGYGRSHSSVMETVGKPYATALDAIRDIDDAVRWICGRHGVKTVHLVGGSWGSITTALYVSTGGADRVSRLVLYAPIFAAANEAWLELLRDPEITGLFSRDWAACRIVDEASVRARWDAEIPDGQIDQWRDESVFQALVQSTLADDPESQNHHPPSFRAPNGTFFDLWEAFNARPLYDPPTITCPTLLIRGSADPTSTRRDALALFEALGATEKTYVEIANGAHFVSAERRAPQVFATVNAFLTA